MASERLHIVPHEQGWALRREGASKVDATYPTQKEAIDAGRDIARTDEVDLVVHRQDGTFRNVLTFTNGNMNTNGSNKQVQAHDVFSVGSRVSWPAIVAGASVALAMNAVLWLGGAALGITVSDKLGPRALTVAGALWMMASSLASLFVGGFVVSRLTTGEEQQEAVLYGVILWGFLFAVSVFVSGMGVSIGSQIASLRPSTTLPDREVLTEAKLTEAQIEQVEKLRLAREQTAGALSPQAAAWWAFASLILSVGAAIGGAYLGAGPDLFIVTRVATTGTPTVAVTS